MNRILAGWPIQHCNCSMVVERRSSLTIIGKTHSKLAFRPRGLRRPTIWSRAIRIGLQPGNYTAVLSGKNNTTDVGLVEFYDIEKSVSSALTNVSTRGFVGTDQNVMIGGFITEGGNGSTEVVVHGLGPTPHAILAFQALWLTPH